MKHIRYLAELVAFGALAWSAACSSDEPAASGAGGSGAAPDAGSGGSGGGGGSGGSGGSPGGAAGADGGGEQVPVNPRAVAVVTAPSGSVTTPLLLAAGTDFTATTEVGVVDVGGASVTEHLTFDDGDAVPAASGGVGFVLERTNDVIHVLGADGKIAHTVDMQAAPTGGAVTGRKAYVLLYATNDIAVVDVDAGTVTKHIDLSSFQASGDSDGAIDMDDIVFDAAENRAYVTLGRIDLNTIQAPNFELACPTWNGLVVGIDATTDAVVDLNGASDGEAAELSLVSPSGIHLDSAQNRVVVLSSGCMTPGDGGSTRTRQGVEAVDLATGAVTVLLAPDNQDYLNRLVLVGGGQALLNTFDDLGTEHWYDWTLGAAALGADLTDVPSMPSFDGAGGLLGIRFGASAEVVRYELSNGNVTTVVGSPWTGSFSSAGGTALVR